MGTGVKIAPQISGDFARKWETVVVHGVADRTYREF
jgi:hypothetical protein